MPPGTAASIYLAGIQTEGHFETFCELIDRKDLLDDPRFANGAARQAHTRECIAVLDEIFAGRDLERVGRRPPGICRRRGRSCSRRLRPPSTPR